jgi:hypothetical protein
MSAIRVLLQESPIRCIALATQTHALVLKSNPSKSPSRSNPSSRNPSATSLHASPSTSAASLCTAEFGPVDDLSLDSWVPLSFRPVFGTLGLISINNDIFVCVVSSATRAADARPGETVEKINNVEFRTWFEVIAKPRPAQRHANMNCFASFQTV